jgi:dTMP kinase
MLLRQALTGRRVGHKAGAPAPMDPVTMALLFAADRADHIAQEVLPTLEGGTSVISDRYVLSSIAYQGLELDAEFVESVNRAAPAPDVTLFLDVPPKVAQERRLAARGRDELYDALALQQRIDRNYRRAIAHRRQHERIEVIDGTLPPDQVTQALLDALRARR